MKSLYFEQHNLHLATILNFNLNVYVNIRSRGFW